MSWNEKIILYFTDLTICRVYTKLYPSSKAIAG